MAIIYTNVYWKVIFSEQRQDILKYNGGNGGRDSEGSGVVFQGRTEESSFLCLMFFTDVTYWF